MPSTRRTLLASGLAFLSGCSMVASDGPRTGNATATSVRESDGSTPAETLRFGESHVDTGLEITVEAPTVEAAFDHDGKTYEMPEGDALAFASATFHNTRTEGSLPIDGPIFTLAADGTETLETHRVRHPAFDPSVRVRRMEDVSTTQRWSAEGGTVAPGERLGGTAVFRVPESTDPSSVRIVYESDRIRDDRFGDDVAAWTG